MDHTQETGGDAGAKGRRREGRSRPSGAAALRAEVARLCAALAAERQASAAERARLQRQLSHRMKNTLSMVQAIVTQSLRHGLSPAGAARAASDRIEALGRAQDALTDSGWEAADLRHVVEAAVEPFRDGPSRFAVRGLPIPLGAQQAMGISLAIHELAANAAAFGALSSPGGAVGVDWRREPDGTFAFSWIESGGPPVLPATREGFGTRLTERVVPAYFGGTGALEFHQDGLRYRLAGRVA